MGAERTGVAVGEIYTPAEIYTPFKSLPVLKPLSPVNSGVYSKSLMTFCSVGVASLGGGPPPVSRSC